MPSEIIKCVFLSCSEGITLWQQAIDFIIPMITDFLVFGLLINWIVTRQDRIKTKKTQKMISRKILLLTDRFLCKSLPPNSFNLIPKSISIGGAHLNIAFGGLKISLFTLIEEDFTKINIDTEINNRIGDLLGSYGHYMKDEDLQQLTILDSNLDECERLQPCGLTKEYKDIIKSIIEKTVDIHRMALKNKDS